MLSSNLVVPAWRFVADEPTGKVQSGVWVARAANLNPKGKGRLALNFMHKIRDL